MFGCSACLDKPFLLAHVTHTKKKKAATTTLHVNHVNLSVFLSCLSREVFKCTDFSSQMVRFGNFTWYTRARRERNALKL